MRAWQAGGQGTCSDALTAIPPEVTISTKVSQAKTQSMLRDFRFPISCGAGTVL